MVCLLQINILPISVLLLKFLIILLILFFVPPLWSIVLSTGIGRSSAYPRLELLGKHVEEKGFKVPRYIREFGVYDSDVSYPRCGYDMIWSDLFTVPSPTLMIGYNRQRLAGASTSHGTNSRLLTSHRCLKSYLSWWWISYYSFCTNTTHTNNKTPSWNSWMNELTAAVWQTRNGCWQKIGPAKQIIILFYRCTIFVL